MNTYRRKLFKKLTLEAHVGKSELFYTAEAGKYRLAQQIASPILCQWTEL